MPMWAFPQGTPGFDTRSCERHMLQPEPSISECKKREILYSPIFKSRYLRLQTDPFLNVPQPKQTNSAHVSRMFPSQ